MRCLRLCVRIRCRLSSMPRCTSSTWRNSSPSVGKALTYYLVKKGPYIANAKWITPSVGAGSETSGWSIASFANCGGHSGVRGNDVGSQRHRTCHWRAATVRSGDHVPNRLGDHEFIPRLKRQIPSSAARSIRAAHGGNECGLAFSCCQRRGLFASVANAKRTRRRDA